MISIAYCPFFHLEFGPEMFLCSQFSSMCGASIQQPLYYTVHYNEVLFITWPTV